MSDLKPLFKDIFLHKMDKDVIPVSMVYRTVMDTADQIKSMETLKSKEFIESFSTDDYGNTKGKFFLNNNEHGIQLNQKSQSRRNVTPEEVYKIIIIIIIIIIKIERKYEMMSYKMQKRI